MTTVTRRYHFSASHRLHALELSDAENAHLYGKCNNPFGHGHDYTLEVTVSGPVDETNGLVLPLARLDALVHDRVLRLFASRNINLDVPQFAGLVPTTENIALVIADLIQNNWTEYVAGSPARLVRVHLQETERNGFEVLLAASEPRGHFKNRTESLIVNA
jgi:6-pyruvoyltetrahydropterin/6-carboxytetrahydropterin synthase